MASQAGRPARLSDRASSGTAGTKRRLLRRPGLDFSGVPDGPGGEACDGLGKVVPVRVATRRPLRDIEELGDFREPDKTGGAHVHTSLSAGSEGLPRPLYCPQSGRKWKYGEHFSSASPELR